MREGHPRLVAILLLVCSLLVLAPTTALAQPNPVGNFTATEVTDDVNQPTALAVLPNGDLLITEKTGVLRLWDGNLSVALDLTQEVGDCDNSERGLLGVAAHPSEDFIYLFYTADTGPGCINRVSSFPFDGTVANEGEEDILLDNMRSTNGNHNGGDIQFGKDNNLYVSIGEAGVSSNAQKKNLLSGKILRIRPNGDIPANNPFKGKRTSRCDQTGQTTARRTCREIFALGLRNPFRIAMNPNASGTSFFINDVGQGTWEEIDRGKAGANYGWPKWEGPCKQGETGKKHCKGGKKFTKPIYAYRHSSGCQTITGGAFVLNNSDWPASFKGKYLFGDFICGNIFRLDKKKKGFKRTLFVDNAGPVTHMTMSADGVLFYTTISGQVFRVEPGP